MFLSSLPHIVILGLYIEVCRCLLLTQDEQHAYVSSAHDPSQPIAQLHYVGHPCSSLGAGVQAQCSIVGAERTGGAGDTTGFHTHRFVLDTEARIYATMPFSQDDRGVTFVLSAECHSPVDELTPSRERSKVYIHVQADNLGSTTTEQCFGGHSFVFDVYEHVEGRLIGNVYVYGGNNTRFRFSLGQGDNLVVDPLSGDVLVESEFDWEALTTKQQFYLLQCKLDCSGIETNRGSCSEEPLESATLILNVHDINDNGPKIKQYGSPDVLEQNSPAATKERTKFSVGTRLASVVFFDADEAVVNSYVTEVNNTHFQLQPLEAMPGVGGTYYQAGLVIASEYSRLPNTIDVGVTITDPTVCGSMTNDQVQFTFKFLPDGGQPSPLDIQSVQPAQNIAGEQEPSTNSRAPQMILTQSVYNKVVSSDHSPEMPLLKLFLMTRPCSLDLNQVTCSLSLASGSCPVETSDVATLFRVDTLGNVFLQRSLSFSNCQIQLKAVCSDAMQHIPYMEAPVTLNILDPIMAKFHACDQADVKLRVFENTAKIAVGNVFAYTGQNTQLRYELVYEESSDSESAQSISLDPGSGTLFLESPLDREEGEELALQVRCRAGPRSTVKRVTVLVIDVDDSAPVIDIGGERQDSQHTELNVQSENLKGDLQSILFEDADSSDVNTYVLNVQDPGSFMAVKPLQALSFQTPSTYYHTALALRDGVVFPPGLTQINATVQLVDTSLCPSGQNNKVEFSFAVTVQGPEETAAPTVQALGEGRHGIATEVTASAPSYSRLITLTLETGFEYFSHFAVESNSIGLEDFAVTPDTGIIYVSNTSDLYKYGRRGKAILLVAARDTRDQSLVDIRVWVDIDGASRPTSQQGCDTSCSLVNDATECGKRCGVGASTCQWRQTTDLEERRKLSRLYETCSYDLDLCPNRKCDELEQLVPQLCPQDCTTSVVGVKELNSPGNRGIARGQSPCWCNVYSECYCSHLQPSVDSQNNRTNSIITESVVNTAQERISGSTAKSTKTKPAPNRSSHTPSQSLESDSSALCSYDCKIAIVGAGTGLLFMCLVILAVFSLHRRRRRSVKLKHIVGSVVSLNNVTSEFNHDENENETDANDTRYALTGVTSTIKPDPKWEVPRQSLVLDKTIGEGEFGKVVRAQATNLGGKMGVTTVAVKMLRDCATNSELRDLLSEYNLLKEVSHRNVISLLGACTLSEQFMLIVEYCSNGSLRSYLQGCRLHGEVTETGCIIYKIQNPLGTLEACCDDNNSTSYQIPLMSRHHNLDNLEYIIPTPSHQVRQPSVKRTLLRIEPVVHMEYESSGGTDDMIEILTVKDLMSIAWQIANGMQYLCDMKLVHRDLAARNVLVTQDRVAKISDFGLSRDIYTEDHYMKRSKGRVPVKWMAPESLYHHVYTAKSDVWSYGVVLWEITTMGATPYPGLQPESLFNLLKHGYRMTKPQGCSDHVYEIMKKCWHPEPTCRPSFKELANIFEKILKDSAGYLDLNSVYHESLPFLEPSTPDGATDDEGTEAGSDPVPSTTGDNVITSPTSNQSYSFHQNSLDSQTAKNHLSNRTDVGMESQMSITSDDTASQVVENEPGMLNDNECLLNMLNANNENDWAVNKLKGDKGSMCTKSEIEHKNIFPNNIGERKSLIYADLNLGDLSAASETEI